MQIHSYPFKAMGSPCELKLYAEDRAQADAAADRATGEISRLERVYSRYRPDSVTTRINRSAGIARGVDVDAETAGLLDYAASAYGESDGLFDLTSGVLRRAWDFRSGRVPDRKRVEELLPLVGWDKIIWRRPRIVLPVAGMELDFGGFVKEYTADCAAQACRAAGIAHGLVDLGGDIALIGPHPDGSAWRVGVQHPRDLANAIAYVELDQGAIATSGDYERFMEVDGTRYCHILNPRTGWPAQHLASVSVLAPQCLIAGTATTIAILKEEQGPAWLSELGLSHLCFERTREGVRQC
ncbi:MAG TPA: FAD:protein FMN transferase [Nevskiaceae bacterium]|nr:FAD:protein FMN transferase [Nevskiaceae bacterium]